MATKRHSKTWEQQAKYYEVDNIAEYMIETYLNVNSNLRGADFL